MSKRGRESISTNESTSRPASRAQRLSDGGPSPSPSQPHSPGSSPTVAGPRLFSSASHTIEEVRAQIQTFGVERTTPFPGNAASSSSAAPLPVYVHNPPLAATNATAYRIGLQPTSSPGVPAYLAAATAGLSIPLLVPPDPPTSTTADPSPAQSAAQSTEPVPPPSVATNLDSNQPATSEGSSAGKAALPESSTARPPLAKAPSKMKSSSVKAPSKAKPANTSSRQASSSKPTKASSSKSAKALGKERAAITQEVEGPSQLPKATSPPGPPSSEAISAFFGGDFGAVEFAEMLSKVVSSEPRVGRVLTVGIGDLLGVTFRAAAEASMKAVGWDPVYWSRDSDGQRNPENLPKAKFTITESMKAKWLNNADRRVRLEGMIFGHGDGWDLLHKLRQSNLEATAFHSTTSWDSGATQQAADIADTAILMFSSVIGGPSHDIMPAVIDRVVRAVDTDEVKESLAGEAGFKRTKMLPYAFEQALTFVLWDGVIAVNVERVELILYKPMKELVREGMLMLCWESAHPNFSGRHLGFDMQMEGHRGFGAVYVANGVHLVQGEEECELERRKKTRWATGKRPTPHNDDAYVVLQHLASSDEYGMLRMRLDPGMVGLGYYDDEHCIWVRLLRHFRGNINMLALQLRKRLFCKHSPHAALYLTLAISKAKNKLDADDICEKWLLTTVGDVHLLLIARILLADMSPAERDAALQPGAQTWQDLMDYRDLLQSGLRVSILNFCRSPIYALEWQDLRAELIYTVEEIVNTFTARPLDHILGWIEELHHAVDPAHPNTGAFNRFAPYPGFAHHFQDGPETAIAKGYTVSDPFRRGIDGKRGVAEDLLIQAVEEQMKKVEAAKKKIEEDRRMAAAESSKAQEAREAAMALAAETAARIAATAPSTDSPAPPPPRGGQIIDFGGV